MHLVFITVIAAVTVAHAATPREEVESVANAIIAADNRADVDTVVSLYTSDAVLMPPGVPTVSGSKAVRAHYQKLFARGTPQIVSTHEEIEVSGKWAFVRGFTLVKPDRRDKFVMLLRREGKSWRIARLIWNADPAPAR